MYTNLLNIIFILLNVDYLDYLDLWICEFLDYLNIKKLLNTINKHTQRYN